MSQKNDDKLKKIPYKVITYKTLAGYIDEVIGNYSNSYEVTKKLLSDYGLLILKRDDGQEKSDKKD